MLLAAVNWVSDIVDNIVAVFTDLGSAILGFIKDGFVELFFNYTTTEAGVKTITGLSPFAIYSFILMGIALVTGLTYVIFNLVRRSR